MYRVIVGFGIVSGLLVAIINNNVYFGISFALWSIITLVCVNYFVKPEV